MATRRARKLRASRVDAPYIALQLPRGMEGIALWQYQRAAGATSGGTAKSSSALLQAHDALIAITVDDQAVASDVDCRGRKNSHQIILTVRRRRLMVSAGLRPRSRRYLIAENGARSWTLSGGDQRQVTRGARDMPARDDPGRINNNSTITPASAKKTASDNGVRCWRQRWTTMRVILRHRGVDQRWRQQCVS